MKLIAAAPGQVWETRDKREAGRQVRVLRADESYAYVVDARLPNTTRETRIAVVNLNTRWRPVAEPKARPS